MRAELTLAHAALSRVVEAMDDHLYTLAGAAGRRRARRLPRPQPRGADRRRRCPATSARGSPSCTPTTARCGGRRSRACPTASRWRSSTAWSGSTAPSGSCSTTCARAATPDGTLLYDGVTRDITERRRLEDELRRARAEAERRARTDELTGALQPPPLRRDRRGRRWRPTRAAAACCCSTPTTSSRSTTCTGTSSGTPSSSSSRAGSGRPRAGRLPGPLGRGGVRRAAAGHRLRRRARSPRAAAARRRGGAPVAVDDVRVRLTISIGATRAGAGARQPRRARRGGRPLPLRGQAPRPQPRLARPAPRRHRRAGERARGGLAVAGLAAARARGRGQRPRRDAARGMALPAGGTLTARAAWLPASAGRDPVLRSSSRPLDDGVG